MANISDETERKFFEACEMVDICKAKDLLGQVNPSRLKEMKTSKGRTCLHVAVLAGDLDLLRKLVENLDLKECIKMADRQGDTALHVAVRVYSLHMVGELVKLAVKLQLVADLCDSKNNKQETPVNVAIRLQFLEAVELLLPLTKTALEDENKFLLHRAVSLNQVKLLQILINFFDGKNVMSIFINLPYEPATNPPLTDNSANAETRPSQPIVAGLDSPLHIAARKKYERMVDLLLAVPYRKKHALNAEGKTPVDIAREVMEYHECFRIIRKLGDFKRKGKAFMYCAPHVSYEKHKRAADMIQRIYNERRNAELVVAALLATMTFTATFTAPGGFRTDTNPLGIPVLISFTSYKVFLLFSCIAFFLALFTCIMWEMTSDFTVGDKMFFITINSGAVLLSFAFTAFGFMAAIFAVLINAMNAFSWVVLAHLILLTFCGVLACLYLAARYTVSRARFLSLCGAPRLIDDVVALIWTFLERCGFLDITSFIGDKIRAIIDGEFKPLWSGI